MIDVSNQHNPLEELSLFYTEISDDELEAAAGDARGLFCSCGGCNSACTNGSR